MISKQAESGFQEKFTIFEEINLQVKSGSTER